MDYVFQSVQGRNALIAAVIAIAITVCVIALTFGKEKLFNSGRDDGH